jgi:hypothetical protein
MMWLVIAVREGKTLRYERTFSQVAATKRRLARLGWQCRALPPGTWAPS